MSSSYQSGFEFWNIQRYSEAEVLEKEKKKKNIRKNILVDAVSEATEKTQPYSCYLTWQCYA